MRYLRSVNRDIDVAFWAQRAREWGFPREITQVEQDISTWAVYGWVVVDAVCWLTPEDRAQAWGVFHLAVDPNMRSRIYSRSFFEKVATIAEFLGYNELVGTVDESWESRQYLERLGWKFDPSLSMWRLQVGELRWRMRARGRTRERGQEGSAIDDRQVG